MSGKFGGKSWTSKSVRSSSGVVSKWPSRNSKGARTGETWESRKWDEEIWNAHCKHLEPCMCVTRITLCEVYTQYTRKMCVQQVSVCNPSVAHTVIATTWVRTPVSTTPLLKVKKKIFFKKKHHSLTILREYLRTSFRFFLIFLTRTWSTGLLSTNHQI